MILNISEIKQRLTPEGVLQMIGYEKSKPQGSGGEIRDFCPIHGGDNQRSLAINRDTGEFLCHSCRAAGKDLIALYLQAKGLDVQKDFIVAVEALAQYFGIPITSDNACTLSEKKLNRQELQSTQVVSNDIEQLLQSREVALKAWMAAQDGEGHPYFTKKGVEPPLGVKYGKDEKDNVSIVVPFYDVEERLQALQYVNERGKFFATATTFKGAFFSLGCIKGSKTIYLCEGIATAVSIWLSQNKQVPTISCGACWNILKVVKAITEKYPTLEIIVCLDDDHTAEKMFKTLMDLNVSKISFRKPNFNGLHREVEVQNGETKILDKDFNDLHKMTNLSMVYDQLQQEYVPSLIKEQREAIASLGLIREESLIKYYGSLPLGIDIGLKAGEDDILLPAGGYSVFAAPTKHGKTHALVNTTYIALQRNEDLQVVFITLEELSYPILLRFMNRHIEKEFSKNNTKSLRHFYKHFGTAKEMAMFKSELDMGIFHKNRKHFENEFLANGRLRILDLSIDGGKLSIIETLCAKIEDIKRWLPNVRMIAIDYLQLLTIEKQGRLSRDEILKEVCLKLKDIAAKTGLTIVTAAQFNRTVQNEDDLHPSAIGEGGPIERHAALVIGMWNRLFPQVDGGKKLNKPTKSEILLNILLNRHGVAHQKLIVPYDGNLGKMDFRYTRRFQEQEGSLSKEEVKSTYSIEELRW